MLLSHGWKDGSGVGFLESLLAGRFPIELAGLDAAGRCGSVTPQPQMGVCMDRAGLDKILVRSL
jgi:hypothetical protein